MGAVDARAGGPARPRPDTRSSASTATSRRWPVPSSRPGALAGALADVQNYPHGGYTELTAAVAALRRCRAGERRPRRGRRRPDPSLRRAFAGPGDRVAIADDPTYPLFRIAANLAGAEIADDDPAVTFCCRPNNPTGALDDLPAARPLIVDEAYFEYAGETAADRIDEGIVVLRTFSKAFGLAGARVGYALADADTAAELNRRQAPAAISTLSAALAVAALADPPDVSAQVEERERLARGLRALGLEPLPSRTNFLFVPVEEPAELGATLLRSGLVVRIFPDGIRASVRDEHDDDLLLEGLARALDRPAPVAAAGGRAARHLRATAETRVRVRLALDGAGRVRVATGAGIYDHFLEQLAFHAGFDLDPRGRRRPRDRRAPHGRGRRDRARRGARPGAGRPARDRALRRRRRADGRRARAGGRRPGRAAVRRS